MTAPAIPYQQGHPILILPGVCVKIHNPLNCYIVTGHQLPGFPSVYLELLLAPSWPAVLQSLKCCTLLIYGALHSGRETEHSRGCSSLSLYPITLYRSCLSQVLFTLPERHHPSHLDQLREPHHHRPAGGGVGVDTTVHGGSPTLYQYLTFALLFRSFDPRIKAAPLRILIT